MTRAAEIAARLDDRKIEVLAYLFPEGRRVGHEFVVGSLAGEAGNSLKVSLNGKGTVWADFATGDSGGDLLDLWARRRCNGDLGEAMRDAAAWLGMETGERGDGGPPDRHPELGRPDHAYEYTTAAGRTLGYVYRWDATAERKKEIRPLFRLDGRWQWKHPPAPRPLYGLAELAAHPDCEVLIAEGEKAADGARLLVDGMVCLSWPGGTSAVKHVDLSPLKGRRCVLWPDNDEPGRKAMAELAELLIRAGAAEVRVVTVPPGLPGKWDLGDPLPDDWAVDTVERLIADAEPVGEPEAVTGLGEWDAGEDDAPIPPRGWLLGNVFCRRFISSLLADGAVGKTSLRLAQLLSLAIGRPLTGEHVFQRCRVLIVSLEDGADELRRRLRAACLHHGIDRAELKGWLYLATPGAEAGKLAVVRDGTVIASDLAARIQRTIERRKIDIVSIDPFVKSHGVDENANKEIDAVAQILADMAITYDCAVDVPHHTSKGQADAGNANRGRGAGAFKDGGRLIYTLCPMSPEEAQAFGIPERERRSYIRMDSAKVNLAPSAADAKWFRLVGVRLGNGTELYPNGDEVQTVEPWTPPDTWAGLSNATLNEILTAIDAGMDNGERYSAGGAATDRAAWRVVIEHAPDKTEKQAREIINTWLKNDVLRPEKYQSPSRRKELIGLRVNHAKRPT